MIAFADRTHLDLDTMTSYDLVRVAFDKMLPPRIMPMREWLIEKFRSEDGKAFNEYEVPWVTAPNGPCDAIDHPQYRTIWLQWAARCFKTTFAQAVMQRYADIDPCSMMMATVDETLCKQVFGRMWSQLGHCPALRNQCPTERLQSKTEVRLAQCKIYGAWAGGKSRLADKGIRIGHANEVDKWPHDSTSTEGDPLPRFLKRGGQFSDRKFIIDSTPGEKQHSRIEPGRLRSTNSSYWVPCPRCGKFQSLEFGKFGRSLTDPFEPPGVVWELTASGRHDPDLAAKTAHYVCGHCHGQIDNIHRPAMMAAGVWVHQGCDVDHDRAHRARELPQFDRSWMIGEPMRDGQDWGSQLAAWCAPIYGWGDLARARVIAADRAEDYRQWVTEDAAETWARISVKTSWEELVDHMLVDCEEGVVPHGYTMLTAGVDKQNVDKNDQPYPFVVTAWGPARAPHIVTYGYATDFADIESTLLAKYPHADGGTQVTISRTLLDSGFRPAEIADFVRRLRRARRGVKVQMAKGSSAPLHAIYKENKLGPRAATPGEVLVNMDTDITQDWVEGLLQPRGDVDEGNALTVYRVAHRDEHQDLAEQLLNDARDPRKGTWDRINTSDPNDYRDCLRMAKTALERETRRGRIPKRKTAPKTDKGDEKKKIISNKRLDALRPKGWL